MILFVLGLILAAVALIALLVAIFGGDGSSRVGGGAVFVVGGLLAAGAIGSQTFYTQDTGEASVLVDLSGNIAGQETAPGFHQKAPWQSVKTFNIRNQTVSFVGNGQTDYSGGSAQGPQITAQDSDGVSSDIDLNLVYSIDPTKVTEIYKQYRDESNFVQQFVVQQVRSVTRSVPNSYSTLDLITKRSDVQKSLADALQTSWAGSGVRVDQVNLQEIRPPQSIRDSYAAAQQAQVQVSAEKAKLEATQVSAQQQVVQAKAQAQANAELAKSLTGPILQQHALDTMAKLAASGNLVITDSKGSTLLNVSGK